MLYLAVCTYCETLRKSALNVVLFNDVDLIRVKNQRIRSCCSVYLSTFAGRHLFLLMVPGNDVVALSNFFVIKTLDLCI